MVEVLADMAFKKTYTSIVLDEAVVLYTNTNLGIIVDRECFHVNKTHSLRINEPDCNSEFLSHLLRRRGKII